MIRIGIICPSEIAYRRFLPALTKHKEFLFAGIAVAKTGEYMLPDSANSTDISALNDILQQENEKAKQFTDNYGGVIYKGYEAMVTSTDIDALYIPLPPALHHKWAKAALENGKHVLLEKPAALELSHTRELTDIAGSHSLALHENYMFIFHDQIKQINSIIKNGAIGEIRLYRITFGFPKRDANDFRYNKKLGGGALFDAGGYTIKYASALLGGNVEIACANMNFTEEFTVDIYGSATLVNDRGVTAQVAFGMDNSYRCDLEVWGSTGMLTTGRVLTAPDNFVPEAIVKTAAGEEKIILRADDSFGKSINWFKECIENEAARTESYESILQQAILIDEFIGKAKLNTRR